MPNTQHIVTAFEEELEELRQTVSELASFVEIAMENSMNALISFDKELAEKVIQEDKKANDLFQTIEETAISIIARRQTRSDRQWNKPVMKGNKITC